MSKKELKQIVADTFIELADALETGKLGKQPVIGVAAEGSEHGLENLLEGIRLAEKRACSAVLIQGEDAHARMEEMLKRGEIQGAVTMHYPFPIGVTTIGRVITPGRGREMFLASTTGTSDTHRVCCLVKNAIYGIVSAKGAGIVSPTVGIANIDGARQAEKALHRLAENGYEIHLGESERAEGGCVMRGNDLLTGAADVMVMDSLTGNLMMKMFSAFTSGGGYEMLGFGYGPGIGDGFEPLILIVSRASGAPVIAGAIEYASQLYRNKWKKIMEEELNKANQAGLQEILRELKSDVRSGSAEKDEAASSCNIPPKEIVTAQIPGIEVMDLDDAVSLLWKKGIYAESGMGCTGPIVRISEANEERARKVLAEAGFVE